MTKNNKNGCLAMYDITIKFDTNDHNNIVKFFKTHCKKWVFQLEKGTETGYLHFQCRISLSVKKRFTTMVNLLDDSNIKDYYLSPTCSTTYRGNDFFYAMKDDTREAGPWTDANYIDAADIDPIYNNIVWRPWQIAIFDLLKEDPDSRIINVLYDKRGTIGKSTFVQYLSIMGIAERIPILNDIKDILQMVCCTIEAGPKQTFVIDMPRALNISKYSNMFAGLETVKDGFAFDIRHKYRKVHFRKPHIWVFCNDLPDLSKLTYNRWKFWDVVDNILIDITDSVMNESLNHNINSTNRKVKLVIRSPQIDTSGKLDASLRADQ